MPKNILAYFELHSMAIFNMSRPLLNFEQLFFTGFYLYLKHRDAVSMVNHAVGEDGLCVIVLRWKLHSLFCEVVSLHMQY